MTQIKKILVSQPQPLNARNPYQEMEDLFGVHFDFKPLIRIEGLSASFFPNLRRDAYSSTRNYALLLYIRNGCELFTKIHSIS